MGRTNIAFFQSPTQGTGGTKCADVTITPNFGDLPLNVTLQTDQLGGHIFYLVGSGSTPTPPVHNGDSATSPTIRIGGSSGTVFLGNTGPLHRWISAVCYQSGYLDSNVTSGVYDKPEGPG